MVEHTRTNRIISAEYSMYGQHYAAGMKTDALSRRLRQAAPQPGARIALTEADFALFEAIDRHGLLPTHYLYEFTRQVRRDYANLQYRLTKFYNGDALGPLLTRPPRQYESVEARYQHAIYGLSTRARLLLAERGTLGRAVPRTAHFVHQLMAGCIGASIELGARARGLRYIPREEIIARAAETRQSRARLDHLAIDVGPIGPKKLFPDDLFGLEYPGSGYRFFAVEVDRNTESIERRQVTQTSFGSKLRAYADILRSRAHDAAWGIPNLTVLTVTTNNTHAERLAEAAGKLGAFADRFAFAVEPAFGISWRVPRGLLGHLLDEPWRTPSGSKDISRP